MTRADIILADKTHIWLYRLDLLETAYMFNKIGLDTIITYNIRLKMTPKFLR